jgi:hypothetical protein
MRFARPRGRWDARRPAAAALATLAAIALLLPGASAMGAASSGPRALDGPYCSYDTGRVDVVLPSAQPYVSVTDAQNASMTASLAVDQILELAPGAATPQVVAVAFPSHLSTFNGSAPACGPISTSLTASLEVLPARGALWAGPGGSATPDGSPVGSAELAINYSIPPSPAPGTGVAIQWTITGWPWLHSSDLLGLELGLTTESGSGLTACGGSAASPISSSCQGSALGPGQSVWGPRYDGLQGLTASGPTALVSWGGSLATASGASVPVSVGALGQSASHGNLFVGGSAGESDAVGGTVSFQLLHPSYPSAPLLRGEAGWFAASAAASVAGGLAGLALYRRRNRAIERAL